MTVSTERNCEVSDLMSSGLQTGGWTRIPIASVEDLSDAVLGAGLEATQMSRAPVTGSLAFATFGRGMTWTSGYIGGRVALTGPLSASMVTLGVGIVMAPGTRHWLNEVSSGAVGVFLPGDEHDALYPPGSMYACVTLAAERLEELAAQHDLVLDAKTLGGTGVVANKTFSALEISRLRGQFERIHTGHRTNDFNARVVGTQLLDAMIMKFAREPRIHVGGTDPRGYARIVARARAFIHENLDQPLSIEKIANAAATSHRTLHRAFHIVLDETPYSYVQKLRLHRIRHELVTDAEAACTVTVAAHRWGIPELGRFAAWYRDLFGELPSQTLARQHQSTGRHHNVMPARGEDRNLAVTA
jgi:AraC-like DNA-binding protein